ncbi:MAG: hypothetical protein AAFU73_02200 [Planctomycetota bacterium]
MLFAPFALAAFTLVPAPLPRAATAAAAPQVASASLECEVRHTDGSASPSVDLVLLSSPWRHPMRPGFVHRVDARADGAGTARADVRIGHSYTAWAVSEVVDGSYSLAGPVGGVSAGMEFALEESEKGQRVVAVEVLGLEAWDGAGPFAYDVTCLLGDRLVVDCELDGLGRAVIPPMPDAALFRVRSGAGVVIAAGIVPLGAEARAKEAEASRSAGSVAPAGGGASFVTMAEDWTRVTVPPPVRLAVEVRGPKGPARDARIAWYGKPERTLLAVANRRGRAELLWPSDALDRRTSSLTSVALWIEAPGCATTLWSPTSIPVTDADGDPVVHTVDLSKGHSLEGRIELARSKPLANAPLLVHTGYVTLPSMQGTPAVSIDGTPRVVRTDAKGKFQIEGLAPDASWQVSTLLMPAAATLGSEEYPLAPSVVLAAGENAGRPRTKLGKLSLSSFAALDLTAPVVSGAPSDIVYRGALNAQLQEQTVGVTRAGPGGRIRVLAPPKSELVVEVPGGASRTVDVGAGKKPQAIDLGD